MLRRYASPATDVAISVRPRPLYAGDVIDAEVTINPHNSFVATAGVLRLSQIEVLRIDSARDAVPQMMLAGRRGRSRVGPPDHVDHVFVEDAPLEGGSVYKYTVQLRLPAPAPPTVKGKYAQITWRLSASVLAGPGRVVGGEGLLGHLSRGRAGESSQELVVFTHPDPAYIGGERLPEKPGAARHFRNVSLDLSLDTGLAANGGEFAGALSVESHAELKARELRVELIRWERSGSKQVRVAESRQVLQRPALLSAGERTEWAFRLPVPDRLMPSVLAQHTFVGWQVRAVVDRALRPNFTVAQLVQVYTSP
ncbi:MAG: hypothetical protein F4W95_00545 [Chloroflexi bacterium]|nr:hypothetical protein [Chloroflexota bacterium]MYD46956.1 hypothetical protein [Chloroflexota bacterium]